MRKGIDKYNYGLDLGSMFDFKDKKRNTNQLITYMLNRTQSMFKYNGLPDTIPQRILELYLQTNGNVCFYKHEGELYVFTGGLGGVPDEYYMPTIYTIANPYLKISKSLKINEECVVIPNDSMYVGLLPLFSKYASAMAENELSMRIANINTRIITLLQAPDDRTKSSAEKYLQGVEDGNLGVIGENSFLDGLKATPYASGNDGMTNLIEYEQYLKASWFNELGLDANYNMKRESLNSAESQMNNDALLPLIDNMLECRRLGIEKVNEMFGTEISVDLASSWEINAKEMEMQEELLESAAEDTEETEETEETEQEEKDNDNEETE